MVLLLILTLLGLQGLNNVTLQERMAGSSQDALRALTTAESGLAAAMRDPGLRTQVMVANRTQPLAIAPPAAGGQGVLRTTGANYLLVPRGETAPPAGSGFSVGATAFHFERIATGFGEATPPADANADFIGVPQSAVVRLHGGVYQIGGLNNAATGSFTEESPGFQEPGP
jgi:hypothetical protein